MTTSPRTRRRKGGGLFAVFALLAAFVVATVPAGAQNTGDAVDDYLLVTLTGDGAAYDNTASTNGRFDPDSQGYARILDRMQRQHARFADQLARVAPGAEIVNEFFITANAVTVKLNGASPSAIGSISGVQRSQESTLYRPTMNESVELIFADDFWAHNAGREDAGAGVTVGVIDSGILGSHEFFDCKAVEFGGFYFSGVTGLPSQGVAPPPAPGVAFVSDHGTHVSGTVGGCVTTISDGFWTGTTLSGVAPAADLVDYNVFPGIGAGFVAFDGSAFSHDIGEAIEDAVVDGVAVINMSLSGGSIGQHDFLAEVSNGAAAAGVVVVAATGNDGPDYFTVGSPASGSEVIGVGATTNSRGMATLVNTNEPDSYDAETGDFALFDGVTSYDVFDWSGNNDGCTLTGAESYTANDVVLISRGTCSFTTKIRNAETAGAGGVIMYNNVPGADPIPMGHDGTSPFPTIPAVMVSFEDGTHLESASGAGGAQLEAVIGTFVTAKTPNLLADFSNVGPVPFTYEIKPDVVAPGVDILSSVFFGGDWALFNGTSMASPHVAGAAAALLGEHAWTPAQVKSALVTTATILAGYDVWQQGGGLIDLDAADQASVFFYPSNASFGHFVGKAPANGSIDIEITGGACTIDSVTGDSFATASISGSALTVEFEGGRDAPSDLYDGYVFLDCHGDSDPDYHIPWGAVVDR